MRAWTTGVASLLAAVAAHGAVTITDIGSSAPTNYTVGQSDYNNNGGLTGTWDYSDDAYYPSQSFTAPISGTLTSITFKGAGSIGGDYAPNQGFSMQLDLSTVGADISSTYKPNGVIATYVLASLGSYTATCPNMVKGDDYFTITLDTPIAVTAGTMYAYSLKNGGSTSGWFGFAHPAADSYAGGFAFDKDAGWTANGANGAALVHGYDYAFYATIQPVPEPASLALLGLGSLVLVARRRLA